MTQRIILFATLAFLSNLTFLHALLDLKPNAKYRNFLSTISIIRKDRTRINLGLIHEIHNVHPVVIDTVLRSAYELSSSQLISDESMPMDGFYGMLKYRDSCPPEACIEQLVARLVKSFVPLHIIKYSHPLIMGFGSVYMAILGYNSGQLIKDYRNQKRIPPFEEVNITVTSDIPRPDFIVTKSISIEDYQRARKNHPLYMSSLLTLSVIGFQSGLSSGLVLGQPLAESLHFKSAIILFIALTLQAAGSNFVPEAEMARKVHSSFGFVVLVALCVHISTGVASIFTL